MYQNTHRTRTESNCSRCIAVFSQLLWPIVAFATLVGTTLTDTLAAIHAGQELKPAAFVLTPKPVHGTLQEFPPKPSSAAEPTEAERIASLERTIESEEKRLKELGADLNNPDSEYAMAEREFREIDRELEEQRERLQQLQRDGKTQEAVVLQREIKSDEKQWKLAKDRFELAIEERKTLREEITTLKLKTQKDREALADLKGENEPQEILGAASTTTGHANLAEQGNAAPKNAAKSGTHPETKSSADESNGSAETAESSHTGVSAEDPDDQPDEELMQAEAEAKEKEEEAKEAQEEAKAIASRIADLQKIISQEQKILALARKKVDLALATQQALEEELTKKQAEGAAADELQELRQGIAETKERHGHARADVTESTDRLNDSRSELASLQQQQIIAMQESQQKRLAAETAKEAVDDLRSPFALRNLLKWAIEHGPRVLLYLIGMVVLFHTMKVFSHRIIKLMVVGTGRGTTAERENRAHTLVGVFQNAASVAVIIGGTLMVLDEMGAKIGVLLGGFAVVGLAVAFGAQNIMKDYFYGFVMLLENQYMLHDVVRIGGLEGQVERITLRMTVLRDGNGVVHFIPNGQINCVSNETHGWSRATFEIGVAYKENVDHVMNVLTDLARQLRADPTFGPMILDDATAPGIESLGDSAVVIKFHVKTRPHQHGAVKRELLRRIKNRFDELGIEIPFPHRTVYHRQEAEGATAEAVAGLKKCA